MSQGERCMCGDPECASCGTAQGTRAPPPARRMKAREAAKVAAARWSGYTFAVRVSSKDPEMRFMVGLLVMGHRTDELYRLPIAWGRSFEAALANAPERPGGVDLRPLCMVYTDGTVRYADGRPETKFEGALPQLGAAQPLLAGAALHTPENR